MPNRKKSRRIKIWAFLGDRGNLPPGGEALVGWRRGNSGKKTKKKRQMDEPCTALEKVVSGLPGHVHNLGHLIGEEDVRLAGIAEKRLQVPSGILRGNLLELPYPLLVWGGSHIQRQFQQNPVPPLFYESFIHCALLMDRVSYSYLYGIAESDMLLCFI